MYSIGAVFTNYDWFMRDPGLKERIEKDPVANQIIDNLTEAGVLRSKEDEEEEEETDDLLMDAVEVHQKTLREEIIDREKNELISKEMKEILDNMAERSA